MSYKLYLFFHPKLKRYNSIYEDNKDLITLGAYRKGNDADLDRAVLLRPKILDFIKQEVGERVDVELGLEKAKEILG